MLQSGHRHLGLLGCAPCAPSGGSFWPPSSPNPPKRTSPARSAWLCSLLCLWWFSSPNPPKRTSPAWSAGLCSLLSLWWAVLASQQPKSFKTDLALPLVVRLSRSAAQILQNGPAQGKPLICDTKSPSSVP